MDTALFVANTAGDHRSPLRYDANGVACQGCCALRDIRYVLTHGGRAWKPVPTNICETAGQRCCAMACARNVGNGRRPFRVLTHGGRAWKPAPTKHMRNGGSEICAMGCATKCRERSATVPCVNAIRRANNGRPYGTMQG